MKYLMSVLLILIVAAGSMNAQEKKMTKEMSITGEVVDVACYLAGDAKGPEHVACATACAKAGGALGILTADGKLYVSLLPDDHKKSPNHLLMGFIGKNVEAKGYVRVKGGVNGLMIRSVAEAM